MRDFKRKGSSNRFSGRNSDPARKRTEMSNAICDECGKNCSVPFKPSGNKKVYCSDCFESMGGRDGNRSGRKFDHQDRRFNDNERQEFTATCDECGAICKLPFKPTSSKPVYCSSCFEQRGGRSSEHKAGGDYAKEIRELKDQIVSINTKLDKIITALEIKPKKVRTPKVIEVTKEEYIAATKEEDPQEKAKPAKAKKVTKKTVKKSSIKKAKKTSK